MKLRKDRNPRYQTALDLAETKYKLMKQQTDHNFKTVLELADIGTDLKKLTNQTLIRNERLVDAYLRLSARYWDMVNRLASRESRLDLVTQQLKNYVPDHWLFEEDSADDAEDNKEEPDPEPRQPEFDFWGGIPTKH